MKIIKWIIGGIFALALIMTTFLTAFEIALYSDLSFYEKEYQKYDVADDVYMEMDDLLIVTDEMMKYLKGSRDDLLIKTEINGLEDYFFNETEIAHMEDVRELFLAGFALRSFCIAVLIICLLALVFAKVNWSFILARSLKIGIIIFCIITILLTVLISINFTNAFIIFHKLFFNNNLWILNPETDRLINILPEGFFLDTSIRIGIIFGIFILLILVLAFIWEHVIMKNKIKI